MNSTRVSTRRKRVRFALAALGLAGVWLWLLPALARVDPIRRQREFLERQAINPSAMIYAELESFPRLQQALRQRQSERPLELWVPASWSSGRTALDRSAQRKTPSGGSVRMGREGSHGVVSASQRAQ